MCIFPSQSTGDRQIIFSTIIECSLTKSFENILFSKTYVEALPFVLPECIQCGGLYDQVK
jgi:hypothetical protein